MRRCQDATFVDRGRRFFDRQTNDDVALLMSQSRRNDEDLRRSAEVRRQDQGLLRDARLHASREPDPVGTGCAPFNSRRLIERSFQR